MWRTTYPHLSRKRNALGATAIPQTTCFFFPTEDQSPTSVQDTSGTGPFRFELKDSHLSQSGMWKPTLFSLLIMCLFVSVLPVLRLMMGNNVIFCNDLYYGDLCEIQESYSSYIYNILTDE